MFKGKPILAGNSDLNQAQMIFDLVGSLRKKTCQAGVHSQVARVSSLSSLGLEI
jgi:hypothetical protein